MNIVEWIAVFVCAALVTLALVPLAKRIALRFDAVDYPDKRRVNRQPIPRMGGLAMFGGLIAALILVILGVLFFGWRNPMVAHPSLSVQYVGVGIGVVFMVAVGVIDDVKHLSPGMKFLGQVIAACIVAFSGLLLSNIRNPFGPGFVEFGWVSYPLTVFYLVAFANIINLIDGLDGLASGITAISSLTIFAFSLMTGRWDSAVMAIALAGICIGFLRWNFHPAKIFMGDSGSLLLGFALGIISLFAVARSALVVSMIVPLLAAGVPIVDTALAIFRRLRAHRRIDEADRGHIHHRLMEIGFSQRNTVLIMWAWTAALAVCSVAIARAEVGWIRIIAFVLAVAITIFGIVRLRLFDQVLLHHFHPRGRRAKMAATLNESVEKEGGENAGVLESDAEEELEPDATGELESDDAEDLKSDPPQ